MVREVRVLWSDPFVDLSRSFDASSDELDDLDLTPLKKRRVRRRKSTDPDVSSKRATTSSPAFPPESFVSESPDVVP